MFRDSKDIGVKMITDPDAEQVDCKPPAWRWWSNLYQAFINATVTGRSQLEEAYHVLPEQVSEMQAPAEIKAVPAKVTLSTVAQQLSVRVTSEDAKTNAYYTCMNHNLESVSFFSIP